MIGSLVCGGWPGMLPRRESKPKGPARLANQQDSSVADQRKPNSSQTRAQASTVDPEDMDAFLAGVEQQAYRIALYALRDEQMALDVVQDSMLKLVEKYLQRPAKEWAPLFFTILNNRITDTHRWNSLRERGGRLISLFRTSPEAGGEEETNLLDTGLGVDTTPGYSEPENQLLGQELGLEMDRALDQLSPRQRQVFLLRDWQGFNVRETAAILGCSQGSVKQHHFRAMQALRRELAEVWDHE